MYNFIMNLYSLGVRTAALFNDKVRKMWQGEQAAISVLQEKVDPNASYIWFHAASLGEFEQGRPLTYATSSHSIKFCLRSSRPRAMRCVRTTREPTSCVTCRSTR